jgi:glycosyltransferase involved in cell wall biosynthesis
LYQYALTLVDCLARYAPEFEFTLYQANLEEPPFRIDASNWRLVHLPAGSVRFRMGLEYLWMTLARFGMPIPFRAIPEFREIRRDAPEIMIYVKPTLHIFHWKYVSIFPIHDLQHRLQPEFPEVSANGEYQRREYMYARSVPAAAAILTDSMTGKEDVAACYRVNHSKIFSLPYIAPTFRKELTSAGHMSRVREKYSLPDKYFFYPAAFWEHKNHRRLIRAVAILATKQNTRIHLLLAGSKKRGYSNLAGLAASLKIDDLVHFIGYVPDDDLAALYRQALALVMPTFFGPTNIPILEAWAAGCPVITSDLRGIREQVDDAGLLVNPLDETEIAEAMWLIHQNEGLRLNLIKRGKVRASKWTPQQFAARLADVIRFASNPAEA